MIAYTISRNNKVVYVGIYGQSMDPARRWRTHINLAMNGLGSRLHAAIREYGADAFSVEAVACASTWKDLCKLERSLIEQHKTYFWLYADGYNMTVGGEGGVGAKSPEWRAKIAAAHLGRKRSDAARTAMSVAHKNKGIPASHQTKMISGRVGKMKPTDEWKANISRSLLGHAVSQETRDKIAAKARARGKQSPEVIAKQVASRAGYKHSEDTLRKMSEAMKGRSISEKTRRAVAESNRRRARPKAVA